MMTRLRVRRVQQRCYWTADGSFDEKSAIRMRLADDTGSALVLALVFLVFFGLVGAAVLSYADTSFRTTIALRSQRAETFAADGAVKGAIEKIKGDVTSGNAGGTCPTANYSLPENPPMVDPVTVTVTCEGIPGSGASAGGGANPNNTPGEAIRTLSTDAGEDGIFLQDNNATLTVLGGVLSASSIRVSNQGTLAVTGTVTAHSCPGPGVISATGGQNCASTAAVSDPGNGNPGYDPLVSSPPPAVEVPGCSAAPGIPVIFPTGTYTNADKLSNLTNGGCPNRTFIFLSGAYYFDFIDSGNVNCGGGADNGTHQWCINDATVVVLGGTPDPTSDGCLDGVQFLFGEDSRLNVKAGTVMLCAKPSTTRQQIAIYGLRTGVTQTSTAVTATVIESSSGFNSSDNARVRDGVVATATVDTVSATPIPSSASVTLTTYTNSIPADATISVAKLKIRHFATGNTSNLNLSFVATPGGGSPLSSQGVATCVSLCEEEFNLASSLNTTAKIAGLKVRYTATEGASNKTATESLDSIWLDVTYTPSGFKAESGCAATHPYPGTGACPLIKTDGNNTTFIVTGTVYAPLAALHVKSPNNGRGIFQRGVIARALRVELPTSSNFNDAAIRIPGSDSGGLADRTVLFVATINGRARLRALVAFGDLGGVAPGSTVTIKSWSVIP